jgi:hypothetical protein
VDDLDPAGLDLGREGDDQTQDTLGVAGGEVLRVHPLTEVELPGERPLGPFGDNDLLSLAVVRAAFGADCQGAVDYLKRVLESDEPGGMITIQEGHMVPLPFGSFSDPETGRVRIRLVNTESSSYRVAREYMIRLDPEDLEDPDKLRPIAKAAGLTPAAFRDRYGYLAER